MRDLTKLTEAELPETSGRTALRLVMALVMAVASGGLAFSGMMARYSAGDETILPGMDQFDGQVAWSATLGIFLVSISWLIRGVIAQRLQWAILLSLLIHLLLCFTLQVLHIGVPLDNMTQVIDIPGRPLEELSLPDYGGLETPKAAAAWEQPANTPARIRDLEPERQKTESNDPSQPQPVNSEHQKEIAKVELMPHEENMKLQKEAQAALERQMREQEAPTLNAVAAPEVNAANPAQMEAESRVKQSRQTNAPSSAERTQEEIAASDPRLEAAKVKALRSDPTPQAASPQVQMTERTAAQAEVAASAAAVDVVKVATAAATQAGALEQAVVAPRQQSTGRPAEQAAENSPASRSSTNISSLRPDRAAGVGDPSNAAPTSGGAASIARANAPAGTVADTSAASAESVNVAATGSVGAPRLSQSAAAAATATRGQAATVPLGTAAAGTGMAVGSTTSVGVPSTGIPGRSTAGLTRQATGAGQPQLGQAGTIPTNGTGGAGGTTGLPLVAAGARAKEVGVASSGASPASQGKGVLAGTPSGIGVGRQSSELPTRATGSGSSPTGTAGPSSPTSSASVGKSAAGTPSSIRATTGGGLAERATDPTAALGTNAGFVPGSSPGFTKAKVGAGDGLPSGATTAEQSGTLVFAGPQAQPSAAGRLDGPKVGSVPRRSAGLPGSTGGPAAIAAPSGLGEAQPSRLASGAVRSGTGDDRPKLASTEQVAGLIKQSVPGIGVSPEANMSASLSMRKSESRREATRTLGGSEASEEAVERGLQWLAQHQHPDGHWSIHQFACRDHECTGHGSFHADSAATGLALLAFLGAGYTHQSGQHQVVVERGLKWHLQHQKPDGDLFADESDFVWFYSHGMAAIALCEAYGLTKDAALKEPSQKALDFIIKSQHPEFGGWRYRPRFESDTSVSGWQLMALKSGEMAGLTVPKSSYVGVGKWLDSVESKSGPGQFAYHPSKPASQAMTAEGLLMRQYLGAGRDNTRLISGAEYLRRHLPDLNERDAYFWYYGTQVMFHMQGEYWDEWNTRLRDILITTQLKDGGANGSWSPDRPTADKWGTAGGRHYATCLNLLMLEVYYRHLPLYIELGK